MSAAVHDAAAVPPTARARSAIRPPAPPPHWAVDGQDWPNRACSAFVAAGGLTWHVQRAGSGPILLLLHGTGAATHSWRDLLPLLARDFDVITLDLPGHGFTGTPRAALMSLPGMARLVSGLLDALGVRPDAVVGHSAGAAIAARLVLDGRIAPRRVLSLNGALLPPPGLQSAVFPVAARLLAGVPLLPHLLARTAGQDRIDALLANTGSAMDPDGRRFYTRLFRRPSHIAGAVSMMSRWDLRVLGQELSRLGPALVLVAGEKDGMIPPEAARVVQARVSGSRLMLLPGLGHLAHEEAPERVAMLIAGLVKT